MRPNMISGFLMVLIGAAFTLAVMFGLDYCHTEKPMKCFWMIRSEVGVGLMILLSGIVMKFVHVKTALGLQIANVFMGGMIVALATVLIGPCIKPQMICNHWTQSLLIIMGVAVMLIAAADAWRLSKIEE